MESWPLNHLRESRLDGGKCSRIQATSCRYPSFDGESSSAFRDFCRGSSTWASLHKCPTINLSISVKFFVLNFFPREFIFLFSFGFLKFIVVSSKRLSMLRIGHICTERNNYRDPLSCWAHYGWRQSWKVLMWIIGDVLWEKRPTGSSTQWKFFFYLLQVNQLQEQCSAS